jgi:hypothetical protein
VQFFIYSYRIEKYSVRELPDPLIPNRDKSASVDTDTALGIPGAGIPDAGDVRLIFL